MPVVSFNSLFLEIPSPQLPSDLITDIIKLCLPPESFSSFAERSEALRNFSLMSPVWRELAQEELFRSPVVQSVKAANCFVRTLEERPRLARRVRSLRIRGGDWEKVGARDALIQAGEVLELCPEVRKVRVRNVIEVSLTWFLATPLLESLVLISSTIAPIERNSLPRLHFPHLVDLSLFNVDLHHPPDIRSLLSPSSLPSLRALGAHPLSWGSPSEVPLLPTALASLTSQLDVISLGILGFLTTSHALLDSPIGETTLLETIREKTLFDIRSSALYGEYGRGPSRPGSTPPTLQHIRIVNLDVSLEEFADMITFGALKLCDLVSIYLPLEDEPGAAARRLKKLLGDRGVEVVFEEFRDREEESLVSPMFWGARGGPRE